MKKLVFACVSIILLAACSSKEQPLSQTQQDLPPCTINGHGCWEVVQKLAQTQITYPDGPETTNRKMKNFENPALQAWGITVTQYVMFKDGGSKVYYISCTEKTCPQIKIFKDHKFGSPEYGFVTIIWPDDTEQKFDPKGNPVK